MRQVSMTVSSTLDPTATYALVSRFADYPQLTETVEEVVVQPPAADGSVRSEWTVHFRTGLLRWTEEDTFDDERLVVAFTQVAGDFLTFDGIWAVEEYETGSLVRFEASFDLGIPTLAAILDPVAEATLRENVIQILGGLLGEISVLESDGAGAAGQLAA